MVSIRRPSCLIPAFLLLTQLGLNATPSSAGLRPIGVEVGSWAAGQSGSLIALFIEDRGAEAAPPAFEFCAPAGVVFGTPTVLYPANTTLAAVAGNDCWNAGGFFGTAFAVPGRTSDPADQVWKIRVPFSVPAGYVGIANDPGSAPDPGTIDFQVLGAIGTPGSQSATVRGLSPPRDSWLPDEAFTEEKIVRSRATGAGGAYLSITKFATTDASQPGLVDFNIDVENLGSATSGSFTVTDIFNPGLECGNGLFVNNFDGHAPPRRVDLSSSLTYTGTGLAPYLLEAFGGLKQILRLSFVCRAPAGSGSNTACVTGSGVPAGVQRCFSRSYFVFSAAAPAATTIPLPLEVSTYVTGTVGHLPQVSPGSLLYFFTRVTNAGSVATSVPVQSNGVLGVYSQLKLVTATYSVVHADGTTTSPVTCPNTTPDYDACRTASPLRGGETLIVARTVRIATPPTAGGFVVRDDVNHYPEFAAQSEDVYVAVIPGLPSPVAAPTNLTATASAGRKITLKWLDKSNNEDSFRIEMRVGTAPFKEVASTLANKTIAVVTVPLVGTRYVFQVRARKGTAFSLYSNRAAAVSLH